MYKEKDKQMTFYGELIYNELIPKDHFLRKLKETIDFSFVNKELKDLYSHNNGRPCWEPQIIFKMLLLQFLYDVSDAEIEEACRYRIDFRYFLGLDVNEPVPDATTLVKFRERLGEEKFAKLHNHIVQIAHKHKLISDKLHIVDATAVKAKVDILKIKKKQQDVYEQSPDKDAKFGHTSPKDVFYGYKAYIRMDKESEIITSVAVAPANWQEANMLAKLLDGSPPAKSICGDKAFDTPQNHLLLEQLNIRSLILPKQPKTNKKLSGCFCNQPRKLSSKTIKLISKLRSNIEHKIAQLKKYYSLAKCRYWGLIKTKIQTFLSCIAANLRRIILLLSP
jgi:IS5 family transposase